jgi:hypothetical protein
MQEHSSTRTVRAKRYFSDLIKDIYFSDLIKDIPALP